MNDQSNIYLYNTLTRKKDLFQPIDAANVRMYACGPTVYDFAHIGNARPIIVFDVLFRLLRHVYGEDHVTYVRNITDVDDKINARAASEGVSIEDVTKRTTVQFHKDIAALGVLKPTVEPRATDHIEEMKALIETLVERGHAYVADNHVLFDVVSMAEYGELSKRPMDEMIAGARVEVASYKKNPTDFVLWKPSKDGEPSWPSPSGIGVPGRPGWHIECSAMAAKHLGQTFDIHGGGIDLTFPHHENELAQSRCAHGTDTMANVWMHNGFVQVEGEKMSKSLGNFITINDLLETEKFGGRRWDGDVLRLAMLMTDYRKPIDWTIERLIDAEKTIKRWKRTLHKFKAPLESRLSTQAVEALKNDLNTPEFIHVVKRLNLDANKKGFQGEEPPCDEPGRIEEKRHSAELLKGSLQLLGFEFSKNSIHVEPGKMKIIGSDVTLTLHISPIYAEPTVTIEDLANAPKDLNSRIDSRLELIASNKWAEADVLRAALLTQGIQLNDSKDSETGGRVTTWEVKR